MLQHEMQSLELVNLKLHQDHKPLKIHMASSNYSKSPGVDKV